MAIIRVRRLQWLGHIVRKLEGKHQCIEKKENNGEEKKRLVLKWILYSSYNACVIPDRNIEIKGYVSLKSLILSNQRQRKKNLNLIG